MKKLTADALRQYHETGVYAPVRALSTEEATTLRRRLEAHEASQGVIAGTLRHKTHLVFTWLNDLIRHPGILDAVEDIIGPNILCWGTSFFIKEPRNPSYVSWHQDSTYWGLEPADIVTAWVALSESTLANGAMRSRCLIVGKISPISPRRYAASASAGRTQRPSCTSAASTSAT